MRLFGFRFALFAALAVCSSARAADTKPISLHPDNPHYFLFRGKPAILITSGEHYGAVLNLDFEYVSYLDVLQSHGFNLTRTFSGTYREVSGSFNITGNTLAPAPGRFICPWARADANRFDLSHWDPAYFERLKDFITEAGKRGIVVELVLFCTMYEDKLWQASPLHAANNINGVGAVGRGEVYALKDEKLTAAQEALARKFAVELANFDNVYFEICNEPYERGGFSNRWNDRMIDAIVNAQSALPHRHMIAQNVAHGRIDKPNPHVSVFNFHAARPQDVTLNFNLNKAIAFDESGGSDQSDRKYRTEAWDFILAGGGVYSHLDFSFTTDKEDGSAIPLPPGTPGGGGPVLRQQLQVLKQFMEGFDFVRMKPDDSVIKGGTITTALAGAPAQARASAKALSQPGKAYAVYINGGSKAELLLDLPASSYNARWVNTKDGKTEQASSFVHAGGTKSLASPQYVQDIALAIKLAE